MTFHRVLVALGAAGLSLAVFGLVDLACSDPLAGVPSPPNGVAPIVTLTTEGPASDQVNGPTGSTFLLTVRATSATDGAGVEGLPIAFSSQPSGVTVSPTTVTTDETGYAKAYAFVPYDVQGVVFAVGGGALPAALPILNGAVTFQGAAGAAAVNTPSGTTFPVTVTAMALIGDGGSGAVPGVTVSFAAQPSGVTISPAAVVTDDGGQATAYASVPYDTQGVVLASGGSSLVETIPISNQPVALDPGVPMPSGDVTPTGQFWTLLPSAHANAMPIEGLTLTFSPLQPGAPSLSTAVTDPNGVATVKIFAPWGPSEMVSIVGGGSATWATIPGAGNPVTLSPLCWQDEVDAGAGLYQVTTYATIGSPPVAVPGVSVAFSVVSPIGGSSTPAFQPATAVTNDAGAATSFVALAAAFALAQGVPPQVAVQATAGASTVEASIPLGGPGVAVCPPPQ